VVLTLAAPITSDGFCLPLLLWLGRGFAEFSFSLSNIIDFGHASGDQNGKPLLQKISVSKADAVYEIFKVQSTAAVGLERCPRSGLKPVYALG
jgi:hypothetical protein